MTGHGVFKKQLERAQRDSTALFRFNCLAGEKTTERFEWLECPSVEDGQSR
jgi:hypothetical protein